METSREDVGIAIRSAFLRSGTKQRFSLFILVVISILLLIFENIQAKPINYFRSFIKDTIYRGSLIVSSPSKGFSYLNSEIKTHFNLLKNYEDLENKYNALASQALEKNFLELENTQLRQLIDDQIKSSSNLVSSRVMLDKQSPYLNSFILNSGNNKKIKNGMAVLHGKNFIGRIVDVNFFSSRVLLISDLNSKIAVITEPDGYHAILTGRGSDLPTLEYLPENHSVKEGGVVYTSGKEGIFSPGLPIGKIINLDNNKIAVSLFSNLNQITFVNIDLGEQK